MKTQPATKKVVNILVSGDVQVVGPLIVAAIAALFILSGLLVYSSSSSLC